MDFESVFKILRNKGEKIIPFPIRMFRANCYRFSLSLWDIATYVKCIFEYIGPNRYLIGFLGIRRYYDPDLARWVLGVDCVFIFPDWFSPNRFSIWPSSMRNGGFVRCLETFTGNRYIGTPEFLTGPSLDFIPYDGFSLETIEMPTFVLFSVTFTLIRPLL